MLTGKLVRVRYSRDRIVPCYIDSGDPVWLEIAGRLRELYQSQENRTRGELEEDLRDIFGNDPNQFVHQGLAKLLEDRCEFEVVSGHPPEKLREAVFREAAKHRWRSGSPLPCTRGRGAGGEGGGAPDSPTPSPQPLAPEYRGEGPMSVRPPLAGTPFDRQAILAQVGTELGMTAEAVDHGLFADLKSEQRLVRFKDISAERLLERYNVALAQAVLLRSSRVKVNIRGEPPQRFRQLFRLVKFHRLVCELERSGPDAFTLHLDGPLSLFSATQKYGLQLALFLPTVLLCRDFDLEADLRWGPQRKPKKFTLSAKDGLVSHAPDTGTYVPPELAMFVDLFRKKVADWDIAEESEVFPLGDGFWVPDFRLVQRETGRAVLLEVLGFWRRSSAERHLERLRQNATSPFLLAVSDQLHIDDADLASLPGGIHRFRQMPLPDEIARLATEIVSG